MRRSTTVLSLLVLALGASAAAWASPRPDRTAMAMDMLRTWARAGYEVIHQYDHTPWSYKQPGCSISMTRADFMAFVQGSTPLQMAAGLPTAVHETTHAYNQKMAWYFMEKRSLGCGHFMAYAMAPGEVAVVRVTPTFPAARMANRVPPAARTSRFKVYVSESNPDQTTQKHGIYGLVDELNAYSQGTRAAVDLGAFYEKVFPADGSAWLQYVQCVNGVSSARLEFRIFVLAWLLEARASDPKAYRAAMGNRDLAKAIVRIDQVFGATMRRYHEGRPALLARLRARGLKARETTETVHVGDRGIGTNTEEERRLQGVLDQPEFRAMEQEVARAAR